VTLLQMIAAECGLTFSGAERLHGGDINEAWCLYSNDIRYFLKVNDAALYPGMLVNEAGGLNALRKSELYVPQVKGYGTVNGKQYLLLEWLEKGIGSEELWESFGARLARMHQAKQDFFGWKEDNYIGTLPQPNSISSSWPAFYASCRIMPLIKRLYDNGSCSRTVVTAAEKLCLRMPKLFPEENPSLLHGDLWSGNYIVTTKGSAAIFDPAVYCGHREMDIGMSLLFGGFDARFYHAYNACYPLEHGWQQRIHLTQLYPLLVHAVLFGGSYLQRAAAIINKY